MDLENIKAEIENETGVPAKLLMGENEEECRAQAKALIAFRRERLHQEQQNAKIEEKTDVDLFGEWFNGQVNRGVQWISRRK